MAGAPSRPKAVSVTIYQCPTCNSRYDLESEAERCARRPADRALFSVGDIVIAQYGYLWFDGDERWVENAGIMRKPDWTQKHCRNGNRNCFGPCCTLGFYYVITQIDRSDEDPHRIRYHLFTKALIGRRHSPGGYTFNEDHILPKLVERPPTAVVRNSKDLIGMKAEHLL